MKKILLIHLFILNSVFYCLSQNYALKTIYKGDSVVIISNSQINEINNVFSAQKSRIEEFKLEVNKLTKINDTLISESIKKDKIIDSLKLELTNKNENINTIKNRLNATEKWILESSISSCYLYYSWSDSTIKKIDTEIYMLVGYRRSGNFSLVRMADNKFSKEYVRANLLEKQEPPVNWELNYKERVRPKIINYPFKINF